MRIVEIKVLKNKLSEYVRLASQGETILISDRDRVVSKMQFSPKRSPRMVDTAAGASSAHAAASDRAA